ncbi:DUF779 domain-containing protein [Ideonella paludis]|uniref:DUF779 domain-containing protein n=1 Tax=Ideonella paludis TaxID=1233411 RepID=UPI002873A6B5|nr:DUF779 domain-containing protein [Ideonella paludis]
MADVPRVVATEAARALLARLRAKHGEILIYQSHGCCDGSTPMAFKPAELSLGRDDLLYAEVDGTPLWMGRTQVDYTIGTQLILDVGQGSLGTFSLEDGEGQYFKTASRAWTEEVYAWLEQHPLEGLPEKRR